MKKLKLNLTIILCVLSIISIIQPIFAAYSVRPGASFRWDATYYFFDKDGGAGGSVLEYTHQYTLEFDLPTGETFQAYIILMEQSIIMEQFLMEKLAMNITMELNHMVKNGSRKF